MLPAWYFCCCIGINDRKTYTFLSILECIEDETATDTLISLTYTELRRTETWMQIYTLPHVLRSLHRKDTSEILRSNVEQYVKGLIEILPKSSQNIFSELAAFLL